MTLPSVPSQKGLFCDSPHRHSAHRVGPFDLRHRRSRWLADPGAATGRWGPSGPSILLFRLAAFPSRLLGHQDRQDQRTSSPGECCRKGFVLGTAAAAQCGPSFPESAAIRQAQCKVALKDRWGHSPQLRRNCDLERLRSYLHRDAQNAGLRWDT